MTSLQMGRAVRKKKLKSIVNKINKSAQKNPNLFLAAILFSIFGNLLMLTGPIFMLQVYDRVLASGSEETLAALFALVIALYTLFGTLEYARSRVMARIAARMHSNHQGHVFRKTIEDSAKRPGYGSPALLLDLESVRLFLSTPAILSILDIPWAPIFVIAIFVFHPSLGWLAVIGAIILVVATIANQRLTTKKMELEKKQSSDSYRLARQVENNADYVMAQGMAKALSARWRRLQNSLLEKSIEKSDGTEIIRSFSKSFRMLLQSSMLAFGAILVIRGEITSGAMIAASILMGRVLAPIDQCLAQWTIIENAKSGWANLRANQPTKLKNQRSTKLPRPEAYLKLSQVCVESENRSNRVLDEISFSIEPGEVVGVIGHNGSGKTTLARVITGIAKPSSGEVRLHGATLDQFGSDTLGEYVGYLPQEIHFFEGTISENIAHMQWDIDSPRVVTAATLARVHEVIVALPEGYDTLIGDPNARLSGGQKQRIALARALYKNPEILILDEPTSALDIQGSAALRKVASQLKSAGKAVIIMTHRTDILSACDRLLILQGGKLVGQGPKDQVVRALMRQSSHIKEATGIGS